MKTWYIRKAGWVVGFAALWVFVMGIAVMLLWNALLPDILHASEITYWQAVGILVLSHILFRGFGRWGRHHNGWRSHHWKQRFEEKLAAMTPEEREKFREEWKRRCGWDPGEQRGETQ